MTASALKLRAEALHARRVHDETVILDARQGRYLSLNAAGTELWSLLEAGTDRATLVRRLVEKYTLDDARAQADVDAFLTELRSRALLLDLKDEEVARNPA